jgi:PAT family beta-lactamase induction signal transducer AmpG
MVVVGLVGMALSDPQVSLSMLVGFAVITAFASATQDIVIDAYRIECAKPEVQAALAATYMVGYRAGMIVSGAGALLVAATFDPTESVYDYSSWRATYLIMGAIMLLPMVATLFMPEPEFAAQRPEHQSEHQAGRSLGEWLHEAVAAPFIDFFKRYGWTALVVLAVIGSYRISDIVLGVIANVFYVDMGFTKSQVAWVAKGFGVVMTLTGALLGGALAPRVGLGRMLILGAVLVSLTNLLFAWLFTQPPTTLNLALVISADNLSAGLAAAAFVAYLSGLTNLKFSATQYALFSSLMVLPPKILGGFSGWLVDKLDYGPFFVACALLGIPVVLLLLLLRRVTQVS